MRAQGLLSPHRGWQAEMKAHDGMIITSAPDVMWGTDGVRVFTADDGWVWTFAAVDHWNAECVGWHVCKVAATSVIRSRGAPSPTCAHPDASRQRGLRDAPLQIVPQQHPRLPSVHLPPRLPRCWIRQHRGTQGRAHQPLTCAVFGCHEWEIYSCHQHAKLKTILRVCTAPGFLDSGLTVFASTPPRPARGGRVAPGPGFGSRTSPASTARCTSA